MQKKNSGAQISVVSSKRVKEAPLVSVVVTTKNEEKNIKNCLNSIKNQSHKNIELIIVDNFSEDKTVEIAKRYTSNVYVKGTERSSQRNYGAKIALGEYLIYLDADMILGPSLIEECVAQCERDKIDALYLPERIIGNGFWIKVRNFERSFYTGTPIDAVRFVRRNLFNSVGGFDETLVGPEDWDLDKRIRKIAKTRVNVSCLYHNEGIFSAKKYLEKKSYYTFGIRKYVEKWGTDDLDIKRQIGFFYRIFGVFVEKGKLTEILKNPHLAIAMYYLRLRVAIAFLSNRP